MADELGLAILYGILSMIILNVGFGFQKYGLSPSYFKKIVNSNKRKIVRSVVWVTGAGMTIVSVYLSFIALTTIRSSLIAALGGIGLIALVLFSFFVLKERINKIMLTGMIIIGIGSTLFGLTAQEATEVNVDLSGLTAFIIVTAVFSLVLVLFYSKGGYKHGGVIFGTVSGALAGIGVTLQKCSVATGEVSLQLLTSIFFYGWAVATVVSFLTTQFAFTKGTAITVVPSYNSTALVLPQIGAMFVFGEYLELVRWFAIVLLVIGIVLLTRFQVEPSEERRLKSVPPDEDRRTKLSTKKDGTHR